MREILFRGKSTDNGEWVYGYYVPVCFGRFPCKPAIVPEPDGTWKPIEVKKETVGQYIGLTDNSGKKIFENGYMIIDNKTYKVIFDNAEYILTNIFNCDIITLKNNSIKGVFVDEI